QFAPVAGGGEPQRHLAYYLASVAAEASFDPSGAGSAAELARAMRRARQMEKDERFWVVAALLAAFYTAYRIDTLARLLRSALAETPPIDGLKTWEEALGADPRLFFEVNLPSPPAYRQWLRQHLDERVLVPYL